MNRTLIVAAVFVLTACVNDSPLYVKGFFPLPADCKEVTLGDTQQGGGSLNLSTGGAYAIGLKLISEMDAELDTSADNVTLVKGLQRNTINLDQINLKYTVVPSSITLEPESEALWFAIPPASENPIRLGSLLGEKAIEKLITSLPNAGDRADVRVQMTFSGNIITGGKVVSTPVVYPITVFRGASAPVCPVGQIVGQTGPCGNIGGQDGARLCCAESTAPDKCVN